MAAELVTPVDYLTGIPLPLIQTVEVATERFPADLHHPFHPRRDPALTESIAGQALRNCRVQLVPYELHHHQYHETYEGPELPKTDSEKFRIVVLAAAGYIPEEAITFARRHTPRRVLLSAEQRLALGCNRQLRVGMKGKVQEFLLAYTLSQDLSNVNESTIDEFLNTADAARRQELGNTFLGLATYQATQPIKEMYHEAYKRELIPPENTRRASRFVLASLGLKRNRDKLHERLRLQLAA